MNPEPPRTKHEARSTTYCHTPLVWYLAAGYSRPAGIEVYILNYATEMRRRGFMTEVVVFEPLPSVSHRCLGALHERGIPIRSLRDAVCGRALRRASLGSLMDLVKGRRTTWENRLRWESKKAEVAELGRWIERERPDIVHVQGRLIAEAWAVLPPERTIFHIATAGARDESWDVNEVETFRAFTGRCARVFAPGSGVAERFKRDFGVTREVDVIFTMAPDETEGRTADCRLPSEERKEERGESEQKDAKDAEGRRQEPGTKNQEPSTKNQAPGTKHQEPGTRNQALPPHPLRFGFLGRLHAEKGIHELLEALRLLKERGVDAPFLFAGEGPMEGEIRKSAGCLVRSAWCGEEEKIASHLVRGTSELPAKRSNTPSACLETCIPHLVSHFVRVERVEHPVKSLMQMDVVVLPSRSEAMPVALVEGLMCGRPCIATAVGGVPDLIRDGVEGLLLSEATPTAIAAAMERFLKMPQQEYAGFSERARRRYEKCCSSEVVGDVVEEVYRRVLGA